VESVNPLIKDVFPKTRKSVRYAAWAPEYDRIRLEFGFSMDRERASADALLAQLPPRMRERPEQRLRAHVRGRNAVVVGLAPGAGAPPIWTLPRSEEPPALLVADGATEPCLTAGLVPDVIVTDLDGPVPAEITANVRGALVLVHAHGDNAEAVREWVPQFPAELVGSWAGPPEAGLVNFGGFTDGDRAAFLAEHLGAEKVFLYGFDFRRAMDADPRARDLKLRKLQVAERLLALLAREGRAQLFLWRPDGSATPYGAGSKSTQ
jgi:uncharacterized Rossmann fold enzyme